MNILIANDDGINARGLYELVKALSGEADIYVCAPSDQRSASGHSITVGKPIMIYEVEFEHTQRALEITGTPADCVKLGLKYLEERDIQIDMIFSGINHGSNLGTDTLYSGTVSAAIEGVLCGKPSVAVSVNSHTPTYFDYACSLALDTMRKSYGRLDAKTVLNLNIPDLPADKIKGLKFTRLGVREYDEWFKPQKNGHGETEYWYTGNPKKYEGLSEDIDVISMQEDYASITPLQYDLTNHRLIEEVKSWDITVK